MHFQVKAVSVEGAKMMFGLEAPDVDQAKEIAFRRLPFDPYILVVTVIPEHADRKPN